MHLPRLRSMNTEDRALFSGKVLFALSVVALVAMAMWEHHRMSVAQCYDSYPTMYTDEPTCTDQFSLTHFSGWAYWVEAMVISLIFVLAGALIVLALGYAIFSERWGLSLYSEEPNHWLHDSYISCLITIGAIDAVLALIYVVASVIAGP